MHYTKSLSFHAQKGHLTFCASLANKESSEIHLEFEINFRCAARNSKRKVCVFFILKSVSILSNDDITFYDMESTKARKVNI